MLYLKFILLIVFIEYLLIISHELIHIISGMINKLKISYIYIYPFVITSKNNKLKIFFTSKFILNSTSYTKFKSINIIDEKDYKIKLKVVQKHLLSPYIFDIIIFISLFLLGLIKVNLAFLTMISIIHFIIITFNFFSFDGKYSIGSISDERIAFNLILHFTLFCDGKINKNTIVFLNKKYLSISKDIVIEKFNVNDLWNYINNLSFFKSYIIFHINGIFNEEDPNILLFSKMLYKEYENINLLDNRQIKETSEFLILYYILLYINKNDINFSFYENSLIIQKCDKYFINLYKQTKNKIYCDSPMLPKEFLYTNQERNLLINIISKIL